LVAASLLAERMRDTAGVRAFDAARADRPPTAPLALPGVTPLRPSGAFSDLRYLLMGRIVPAVLYAVLGYEVIVNAIASRLSPVNWLTVVGGPVREGLFAAFCLIPVVLFVVRPKPQTADVRILPRVVAFLGTAILLLCGTGVGGGMTIFAVPAWVGTVCTVVLVGATAGAVWGLLTLRLSFGIFPAARSLVTGGPYRLVRHPLYICEILSALVMVISSGRLATIALVAIFCALQVTRIHYEESLLSKSFPEWRAWAAGRARLIPGVW
jgi:protein-S-isoprenylcysteine O-methyltransferase Ste14